MQATITRRFNDVTPPKPITTLLIPICWVWFDRVHNHMKVPLTIFDDTTDKTRGRRAREGGPTHLDRGSSIDHLKRPLIDAINLFFRRTIHCQRPPI